MTLKVGLIDTGLRDSNLENVESVHLYYDESGNITCDSNVFGDHFGHGTLCYHIINDTNPNLEFLVVKIYSDAYFVQEDILIAAINRCLIQKVDVINISLGIRTSRISPGLNKILSLAHKFNVPIVSAAHPEHLRCFPASHPTVFGIGIVSDASRGEIIYCPNSDTNILLNASYYDWSIHRATSFACAKMTGLITKVLEKLEIEQRTKTNIVTGLLKRNNVL